MTGAMAPLFEEMQWHTPSLMIVAGGGVIWVGGCFRHGRRCGWGGRRGESEMDGMDGWMDWMDGWMD